MQIKSPCVPHAWKCPDGKHTFFFPITWPRNSVDWTIFTKNAGWSSPVLQCNFHFLFFLISSKWYLYRKGSTYQSCFSLFTFFLSFLIILEKSFGFLPKLSHASLEDSSTLAMLWLLMAVIMTFRRAIVLLSATFSTYMDATWNVRWHFILQQWQSNTRRRRTVCFCLAVWLHTGLSFVKTLTIN